MTHVVLDASVAVKWFRTEPGSPEARDLLRRHGAGEIGIVVPSLFVYEFLGVASRQLTPDECDALWARFLDWRIGIREVSDGLVRTALRVSRELGCSFYDAVAPALAEELGCALYSADARAHGRWPGVVLVV